jgi:hypothetical protein
MCSLSGIPLTGANQEQAHHVVRNLVDKEAS